MEMHSYQIWNHTWSSICDFWCVSTLCRFLFCAQRTCLSFRRGIRRGIGYHVSILVLNSSFKILPSWQTCVVSLLNFEPSVVWMWHWASVCMHTQVIMSLVLLCAEYLGNKSNCETNYEVINGKVLMCFPWNKIPRCEKSLRFSIPGHNEAHCYLGRDNLLTFLFLEPILKQEWFHFPTVRDSGNLAPFDYKPFYFCL